MTMLFPFLLAAGIAAVAAQAVGYAMKTPYVLTSQEFRVKRELYKQFDETDWLVFGASFVEGGIDPQEFEKITGDTLFNFGLPSCRGRDYVAVARVIVNQRLPRKGVILDVADWPKGHRGGMVNPLVAGRPKLGVGPADITIQTISDDDGRTVGPVPGKYNIRRDGFRIMDGKTIRTRGREEWEERGWTGRAFWPEGMIDVDGLMSFKADLERMGLRVVLVRMPNGIGYGNDADAEIIPGIVWLDDPGRFPQFFTEEARFDATHLGPHGAVLATQEIASCITAP